MNSRRDLSLVLALLPYDASGYVHPAIDCCASHKESRSAQCSLATFSLHNRIQTWAVASPVRVHSVLVEAGFVPLTSESIVRWGVFMAVQDGCLQCTGVVIAIHVIENGSTLHKMPCYRKDDRAMRPGALKKFASPWLRPQLIFPTF